METRGQKRQMEEEAKMKQQISGRNFFKRTTFIGPRDILVNTQLDKVKVEEPEEDVKPEVMEDRAGISFHELDSINSEENQAVVIEKIEVDLEEMQEQQGNASAFGAENEENILEPEQVEVGASGVEVQCLRGEVNELRKIVEKHEKLFEELQEKFGVSLQSKGSSSQVQATAPETTEFMGDTSGFSADGEDPEAGIDCATEFKRVIHSLLPFLNLNAVLSCRQVCRQWQTAVDSCVEAEIHQSRVEKEIIETEPVQVSEDGCFTLKYCYPSYILPFPVQQLQANYVLNDEEQLLKFQEHAARCSEWPFIGGSATLKVTPETFEDRQFILYSDDESDDSYEVSRDGFRLRKSLEDFLELYGNRLLHVTLLIQSGEKLMTPSALVDVLSLMLPHLASLKTLRIEVGFEELGHLKLPVKRVRGFPRKSAPALHHRRPARPYAISPHFEISSRESIGGGYYNHFRECLTRELSGRIRERMWQIKWCKNVKKPLCLPKLEGLKVCVTHNFTLGSGLSGCTHPNDAEGLEENYFEANFPLVRIWWCFPNLENIQFDYCLEQKSETNWVYERSLVISRNKLG